jgi:hypothetical protein
MTNGREVEIKVKREVLEYVREYTYLGQIVSFHKSSGKEVKRRIDLAWNKFWSLKFILLDKYIKLSTKREVFETCVIPALLYGCQTWSPTSKERKMLQVCQRKMESKILLISIKDRIRNEDVRKQLGTKDGV